MERTAESKQAAFKPLTEQEIRSYTDSGSFSNGRPTPATVTSMTRCCAGRPSRRAAGARAAGRTGGVTLVPRMRRAPTPSPTMIVAARAAASASISSPCCWSGCNTRSSSRKRATRPRCWQDLTREELLALLTALLKQVPDLERRVERLLPAVHPTARAATAKATSMRLDPQPGDRTWSPAATTNGTTGTTTATATKN